MLPPPTINYNDDPFIGLNLPDSVCGKGLHVGNPHCDGGGGYTPPVHTVPEPGTLAALLVGIVFLGIARKVKR